MSTQRSDDFTRDDLGFMQLAPARVLVAVAGRRLDLNDLACQELADRGLDHHGMWVGFPRARAIYERTRVAAPDSTAPAVPTNAIDMTITATIVMDEQRPAMSPRERHRTQRALVSGVRETLSRTFVWSSGSHVTNLTVSFSGRVAE